ncbi:MAG: hypothetical protein IPL90_08080 [Holophagales bacterium]|nr:hypothetical protein [Holophagales bacterium]
MSSRPESPAPEGFWKRHQRHMPRRLPRVLLAAGLLLVPAVVVVRIFTAKPVEESAPAAAPTDAVTLGEKSVSLAGIEVVEAKGVTRAATFDAPAVLALDETRTARIGSLVEGNVVRVLSEVGDRVGARRRPRGDAQPRRPRRLGRLPQGDLRAPPPRDGAGVGDAGG